MKILLLTILYCVGFVLGQTGQLFVANIAIRNDPNVIGTITGVMSYNFAAGRQRTDFTLGVTEFFEFAALTNVRFLVCGAACEATTIKSAQLKFFKEGTDQQVGGVVSVNGRQCTQFNKASPPAGAVTQIFVDAAGVPCKANFANGKTIDFTNPKALVGDPFSARPANCPQPTCTKKQDIMLNFDESGSIDSASFNAEKQFGADIANSFTFSPLLAAMGLVQFDTDARLSIPMTQDRSSFLNQMSRITQGKGSTCIGCGLSLSNQELFGPRSRPVSQGVAKVIITLTDGLNNVGDFVGPANQIKAAGVISVAVGVAQASASELAQIATNGFVFQAGNFFQLSQVLNSVTQASCTDLVGNDCGAGCKGFCSCNQVCLCPDLCESTNQCVVPKCIPGQNGNGCQFPPKNCNDNNACTTDSCNVNTGCVTTPVVCNDNSACTIDFCQPASGCLFLPKDCTEPDPCFSYGCNAQSGCTKTPIFCDRCALGNVTCPKINCKINTCQPATGLCGAVDKNCNDNNVCTNDGCDVNTDQCTNTPISCDDGNACTIDSCDPVQGCKHTPIDLATCDDQSVCTTDSCDPKVGCVNAPITCTASSICKEATCNSVLGCQENDKDCGGVLRGIDPNKQGDCYIADCNPNDPTGFGCFLNQLNGTTIDQCGFCTKPGQTSRFCFLGLGAGQVAGLSAGVIAAIVIAVVAAAVIAAVSGKKGYDVWVKHRNNMQGAQSNPMYHDPGRSGNNPFFEAKP